MKMRSVAILLICVLLTGCMAAVVTGAAASMVVYDRRSITVMERDARIFHVIHSALVADPGFRDSRIVVVSFNRIVLLMGQTPAASLRVTAERLAQKTPNVQRVYDEISIGRPLNFRQQTKDTWITGQVRSQMLTKKGLHSGSIHIDTENGVVYLMGRVTSQQGRLAADVASQIQGVKKVVKVFQYVN